MQNIQLMRCVLVSLLAGIVASAPTQLPRAASNDSSPSGAQLIVQAAQQTYYNNTIALLRSSDTTCTLDNVSVRRAWDDITIKERTEYINAVKCITTIPSRTDPALAPGARSLYDDFVYAHINQTNFIHQSALLLPWHRQFIWAFEQTLRTECNYTGSLPYWAWERHTANQSLSPVFSPSNTSFGSNGLPIPHNATNSSTVGIDPPFFIPRPAGTGGGCITTGAFATHTANLGPVDPAPNPPTNNAYGTAYNPRCLTRDFLQSVSSSDLTYTALATLYQDQSITAFHPRLESGIHPSSHAFIGGDASDFYSSPNDPLFYLLHSQIDRVWTVWQGLDPETRRYALDGTLTFFNRPPSENGTVDSIMRMGVSAGGDVRIGTAMDVLGGEFCYMYV